jgi:D-alanyl-D-alanine carboxypeptidase
MAQVNWKLIAGGSIALIVIALLVQRLTRSVSPFRPPAERQLSAWGTLESETAQQLQSILDEDVNRLRAPGLQAFVRTSDGKTWSGASGTTDLARKDLLRREHILRVGSVTKTLTAVLILKLAEEGLLSLDDPLAMWFPGFPNADAITVRQLLNHTSGIPEFLDTPDVLMKSIIPWTKWQPQELLDIAVKRKPYFAPGSGWHYSNTNYILLGLIAERVTGKTTAENLRSRIIDPLKLANTHFVPYEQPPAMLMRGFDRDLSHFPGMLEIGPGDTSWATAAFTSGALASTADDLGVFYERLFGGALLSPSMMKEMTTFVETVNPGFEAQDGYGLGLMRLKVNGQELVGHVGEFMGSTAIAMVAPDKGSIIVVNANLSFPDMVSVVADMQKIVY